MSEFTDPMQSTHPPVIPAVEARCVVFPCWPTTRFRRMSSEASRSFISAMSLNVSAIFPDIPTQFIGRRTEKSPRWKAFSAVRSVAESTPSTGAAGEVAIVRLLDGRSRLSSIRQNWLTVASPMPIANEACAQSFRLIY